MSTFPESPRAAFVEWCQSHTAAFSANAAAIGMTPAQASAFSSATTAAAAAVLAQQEAQQAAQVATQAAQDALATLRSSAGESVRLIRAFAESAVKPITVYNLAQISPPASPSPMPPPGQPTNLTVTLAPADGALSLRWKCVNPPGAAGTSYIIRRRLPGESGWTFIGVSGQKAFVDDSLMAGPDSVQYTVQAQRSRSSGPLSEIFLVNFGRSPAGVRVASVAGDARTQGESGAAMSSTVNGRDVRKVLPGGSGGASRSGSRA